MKASDKLFEKAPPDVRKLRKQATAEIRKQQRKQWKEENDKVRKVRG